MKSIGGICLAISLLAGVLVFGAAGTAHAVGPGDGGCGFTSVTDPRGSGDDFIGVIDLEYIPPVGQSATVSCEMYVNGVSQGIKLGPVSGTGVIAAAGPLTYTAPMNATIRTCLHIVIGGVPQPDICGEIGPGDSIIDTVVDTATGLVDTVIVVVNSVAVLLDPTLCSALRIAAPTVNAIDPDVVRIDPTYGDVFLFGVGFWDCPPYGDI